LNFLSKRKSLKSTRSELPAVTLLLCSRGENHLSRVRTWQERRLILFRPRGSGTPVDTVRLDHFEFDFIGRRCFYYILEHTECIPNTSGIIELIFWGQSNEWGTELIRVSASCIAFAAVSG